MAANTLSTCKTEWYTLKMRLCYVNLLAFIILASLPYTSTLSLPSGDPAPGRSPGPPELETTVAFTSSEVTPSDESSTVTSVASDDPCAFARVPSESEQVVTVSETESAVNLTVGHAVFDTEQLVRGVVYDVVVHYGLSMDSFEAEVDDIFSRVIGPVFVVKKTPHPLSNHTRILNPRALSTRISRIVTNKLRKGTRSRKIFDLHAPTPDGHQMARDANREVTENYENREELVGQPKEILNMIPQNKILLDRLLDAPINTVPDYDQDVVESITRAFDRIHADYVKKIDELGVPSNISRRTSLTMQAVRRLSPIRLAKIAKSYNLPYNGLGQTGEDLLSEYYFKDRVALERSLALMAQFVYGARFHFLYGMELKARYSKMIKYRIGYSFSVLENLIHQFYSVFFAMVKMRKNFSFNQDENILDYLKLYERSLSISVEFYEVNEHIRQLDRLRAKIDEDKAKGSHLKEIF